MKIYLASSWRNAYQATVLAELRAAGHEVYDFRNPKPGNTGFGWRQTIDRPITDAATLLEALAHPRAKEGFDLDFAAMKWADACVLLLPCGNSAHLEAGWFAGRGKPVAVLVPELREPELMYKCVDLEHERTPLFATTTELLDHLARVDCGDIGMITPDQVRDHMLTPRQRAARAITDAIKNFCNDGDPDAVIQLSPCDDALITELLPYQEAGWDVSFISDAAFITLPEVMS